MLIIDSSRLDPYKNSNEYDKKSIEKDVKHEGTFYHKKITYEKKFDAISRIGLAALAILATLSIIPYFRNPQKVAMLWQQATTGVDRKFVLIKESSPKKNVNFGKVQVRMFDKEQAPNEISNIPASEDEINFEKNSKPIKIKFQETNTPFFDDLFDDLDAFKQAIEPDNKTGQREPFEAFQTRKIPPLGITDTLILKNGVIESFHGTGEFFQDDEIIEKLDIIERMEIKVGSHIYAHYTKHGKAIIQQQATQGCTAGASAMLIMDNGKIPDLWELKMRNFSKDKEIEDIKKAGLEPLISEADNLSVLRKLILDNGSAIVTLRCHVVVVDDISEDLSKIRLREPYHGWEITVTSEAFLKMQNSGSKSRTVRQIKKN